MSDDRKEGRHENDVKDASGRVETSLEREAYRHGTGEIRTNYQQTRKTSKRPDSSRGLRQATFARYFIVLMSSQSEKSMRANLWSS